MDIVEDRVGSAAPPATSRRAMAGITHMTGEVTNGRMLASLSAPFSRFSFLPQTRGTRPRGHIIISIFLINAGQSTSSAVFTDSRGKMQFLMRRVVAGVRAGITNVNDLQ